MIQPKEALAALKEVMEELYGLEEESGNLSHIDEVGALRERLKRWKVRAVTRLRDEVSKIEATNLEKRQLGSWGSDKLRDFKRELRLYGDFLEGLVYEIRNHPQSVLNRPDPAPPPAPAHSTIPPGSIIFLVHGHDELNTRRLKDLLKEQCGGLESIILFEKASSGQTVIEKFEKEAGRASFAFVLMTSDDQIRGKEEEYGQARPNVIFELGWFYGRLGRDRVVLLVQKGTSIHSDLAGVIRLDFEKSVEEKLGEIQDELKTAGLMN